MEAMSGTPAALRGIPTSTTPIEPPGEAKTDIPEELADADAELIHAFHQLVPQHQEFLIHVLNGEYHCDAYIEVYGQGKTRNSDTAKACQLLRNPNIQAVLAVYQKHRDDDILLIRQTLREAATEAIRPVFSKDPDGQPEKVEDLPDYPVRIKAAEALAKLHGANAPAEVKHSGEITSKVVQINLPTRKPAP